MLLGPGEGLRILCECNGTLLIATGDDYPSRVLQQKISEGGLES